MMNDHLSQTLRKLIQQRDELIDVLKECEEYFDNRADADCDQDGFIPNEEMKLLDVVRTALKKAEAVSQAEGASV